MLGRHLGGSTGLSLHSLLALSALVIVCVGLAGLITGNINVPFVSTLPPAALVAVILLVAATPLLIAQWRLAFVAFLCWFMFEDLVRKLAGNNLAVYAIKDLIYVVMLVGLFADATVRGTFKRVTGTARIPLYVLITWAVIMAIPSIFSGSWQLPLVALRLDFAYVPLVIVGAVVAWDRKELFRTLFIVAAICALASSLGIVQALIGPSFLAPTQVTPGLDNLVTVRRSAGGAEVYRPSGPFVDPGRFGTAVTVGMVAGLAASLLKRGRDKIPALSVAAICAAGVWVSGGRSPLIVGFALVLVAALAPGWSERRPSLSRTVPAAVVAVLVVTFVTVIAPGLLANRLEFYSTTLDPRSARNEWTSRFVSYTGDAFEGVAIGGMLGLGTGQESLGKQYVLGGSTATIDGLYSVESGYGSLAIEWGLTGLIMWIVFTIAWFKHGIRALRAARGGQLAAMGLMLFAWMFVLVWVQFFAGIAIWQNYITNALFWLFSGIVFALPEVVRSRTSSAALDDHPRPLVRPPSVQG